MSAAEPASAGVLYCPTCEREQPSGELCPTDGTRLVRLSDDRDPLVGRNLDERFTIEAKLGGGGMGTVYRGRQLSVGRDVAIKVVNPGLVSDPATTKRFLREAKLASRLSHPNIVSVLDFGQTRDGLFYLVMELVHGRTLHEVLLASGRLPLDRIVRIAGQICDALEGAHALPIMHRDLKPANIMLLDTGRDLVKVLDFGLAKSLAVDASMTTVTSVGAVMGTPAFMPPEVANGERIDERADLYSLGCILYVMAAGRTPFVTASVHEMIALHGAAIPEPVPNVPKPVARVIERLLRKRPDDRYPNAAAVRLALEEAVVLARSGSDTETFAAPAPPERPSEEQLTSQRAAVVPDLSLPPTSSAQSRPSHPPLTQPSVSAAPPRRRALWWAAGAALIGVGAVTAFVVAGGSAAAPVSVAPAPAPLAAPPDASLPAAVIPDAPPAAAAPAAAPADAALVTPPAPHRPPHPRPTLDAGVPAVDAPF